LCHRKLEFVAAHSEDFLVEFFTVLIGLQGVTDRRYGRTDAWTMVKTFEALHAVAREKVFKL